MGELRKIRFKIKQKFCDHEFQEVTELIFTDDGVLTRPMLVCRKCRKWEEAEGEWRHIRREDVIKRRDNQNAEHDGRAGAGAE